MSSIKIPPFDKTNYNLWKRKILLFSKASNSLLLRILENGPFVPQTFIPVTTVNSEVIPPHRVPKKAIDFTKSEKEKVALDDCLQLIIIKSLDNDMHKSIFTCEFAKKNMGKD